MRLYHLSPSNTLPEVLYPRTPWSGDSEYTLGEPPLSAEVDASVFAENLPDRVCFAPDVQSCWNGVFMNHAGHLKHNHTEEWAEFHLYEGHPTNETVYIRPDVLCREVWDYEYTHEIAVTSPITVAYVGVVTIRNPYYPDGVLSDNDRIVHPQLGLVGTKINYTVSLTSKYL